MKRSLERVVGVSAIFAAILMVWTTGVLLVRTFDDKELMESARSFVGRDFGELRNHLGPRYFKLQTREDYDRFSVARSPGRSVYVYSGERGVACIIVDEKNVVVEVLHRGSPP